MSETEITEKAPEEYSSKDLKKVAKKVRKSGLEEFTLYLQSPWRIVYTNFLAGIFRGLGFTLGATVVLGLVATVLTKVLGGLPFVGEFFADAGSFIQDIQDAAQSLKNLGGGDAPE